MNTYTLKILLPGKKIYEGEIVSITAQCENGYISVLAGHEPMVAKLAEGLLTVRTKKEIIEGTAGSGMLFVGRNEAVIMISTFVWAGDEAGKGLGAEESAQAAQELS